MEGRAPPIKSRMPRRICETIVSGEVNRPTPTTGRLVNCLTKLIMGSWLPSGVNREGAQSVGLESILTSKRSGTSASSVDDLMRLRGGMFARLAAQFFHADPQRHGAIVADGVLGHLDHLAHQTNPVFDRTAIFVGAAVVFGQQEFIAEIAHAGIHIDDVEPRLHARLARRLGLPAQQIPNVRGIHGPRAQIAHEADR